MTPNQTIHRGLIGLGVDGIVTNYPDRLGGVLARAAR